MTSANTFDAVMGRLLTASNSRNDSELARALGITPQSVSGARKRGEVPPAWIQSYAEKTKRPRPHSRKHPLRATWT